MYSCAPPVWDLHAVSGLGSPLRSHSARVTRRWTAARCAATIVGDEHADRRGTMPPMRGVARGASSRSPIGTMHRWAQPHSWPAGPGQPSCGHGGPFSRNGDSAPDRCRVIHCHQGTTTDWHAQTGDPPLVSTAGMVAPAHAAQEVTVGEWDLARRGSGTGPAPRRRR